MGTVLLEGVLPIFALAAIGYLFGMGGIFTPATAAVLNRFVLMVGVPALGFRLIANAPFAEFDWRLLIGLFISEIMVFLLGFVVARFLFKCDLKEAVLLGMASSFGNVIMFVLPIAINLFGPSTTLPIVAIIALDSIVIFGGTIVIMEALSAERFSGAVLARKICQNPPLLSMVAGIVVGGLSIKLPAGLDTFLEFTGNTAAPLALFALGVVLSQTSATSRLAECISVSFIKLVCHPVFAWLILAGLFSFPQTEVKTSMMVAAAPCGAMAFVLAQNYKVRTDAIAPALLVTMIGSLLSVTIAAAL